MTFRCQSAVIGALCLLSACQAAHMPLPDDLDASERWAVQGRQGWKFKERLRFGPYAAENVDRSWTKGRDRAVPVYEHNTREQHYAFTLRENGDDAWLVKCRTALDKRTVPTPAFDLDLKNRSRLDCALTEAEGSKTWLLTLGESNERPLGGRLHSDSQSYLVDGTTAIEGGLPAVATSGYRITDGVQSLAAVEVVNSGSVVLQTSLNAKTKSMLSAAAAALLLLDELRASLEA